MLRLLILARDSKALSELDAGLAQNGFVCLLTPYNEGMEITARQSPDLVLFEIDGHSPDSRTWELVQSIKKEGHLPIVALVSDGMLNSLDGHLDLDDFITSPYDIKELVLRINQLIRRTRDMNNSELIRCDGLVIDLAECEVAVAGKIAELTFKEYELLKFLASNKGRVYTREALLNMVWGYDYYGGDRTVDVHIRRLRSKIEESKHTFIETVRNIGYRFTKDR